MNSKHLAKGSACPPLSDRLRIFNMRFCPYAQRAVLVAIAKNIPHEIINCNLTEKPEWLFEKNPNGKVPVLELQDGRVIYESLIVAEYLDEAFPNRPLSATDIFQKAKDKVLIEEFNKVITLYYKCIHNAVKPDILKGALQEFMNALVPFEKELENRGTKFFGGYDKPGMVDYMIFPWIERSPVIKLFASDIYDFETARAANPKLEAWRQAMKNDETIKAYLISPEMHKKYYESYQHGKPEYDLLAE